MSVRDHRQRTIQNLLAERGRLSVEELSSLLHVTMMTIRRDLASMEKAGVLTRTHGGCVLQAPFVPERPFEEKDQQQRVQKLAIARSAAQLLSANDSIYLDTGTTAVHLARVLPPDRNLHVFTNNLRVALELFGRTGVEVTVFGGTLARQNPDLVGDIALAHVNGFRIDVAALGADALDAQRGEFYSADMATAMLSAAAARQAERTMVMVDSSKFGKHSLTVAGRLGENDTVITDDGATETDRAALRATGAKVVYATNS